MDNITIYGCVDRDLEYTVNLLRENNVTVSVRDERELNRLRYEMDKEEKQTRKRAKGENTGKQKIVVGQDVGQSTISKAALAQRMRRQREAAAKEKEVITESDISKTALAQRLPRKGKEVCHEVVNLLRENNVTVSMRDEHELNKLRYEMDKEEERARKRAKGKENIEITEASNELVVTKAMLAQRNRRERESAGKQKTVVCQDVGESTISKAALAQRMRREREVAAKGKEVIIESDISNAALAQRLRRDRENVRKGKEPHNWNEAITEKKTIQKVKLLQWKRIQVVTYIPNSALWSKYMCIDTHTFRRVMTRIYPRK